MAIIEKSSMNTTGRFCNATTKSCDTTDDTARFVVVLAVAFFVAAFDVAVAVVILLDRLGGSAVIAADAEGAGAGGGDGRVIFFSPPRESITAAAPAGTAMCGR